MLAYDGGRSNGGPLFPVKLVFEKSNDVYYLLLWEKVVEYSDKTASTNKRYVLSGNFVTDEGGGKRMCTTAAPSTLSRGGGKRTSTRFLPSTLAGERIKKSVPTGDLVQGHGNLVGGYMFRGDWKGRKSSQIAMPLLTRPPFPLIQMMMVY